MLLKIITPTLPKDKHRAKKQGQFNEKQPLQEFNKRSIEINIQEIQMFIDGYRASKVFDPKKETLVSAKVEQVRIQFKLDQLLPKILSRFLYKYKWACLYDKSYFYGCTDSQSFEYILQDIEAEYPAFDIKKFIADVW